MPDHYEWYNDECPYDYSGELRVSGKISKDELIVALNATKSQEKEIEKLIKSVDKNNDGKIDYNEFLDLMQNKQ